MFWSANTNIFILKKKRSKFLDDYFQENEQKEWINIQRKLAKRASSKYKHKKNKKKETIYETRVNIKDET